MAKYKYGHRQYLLRKLKNRDLIQGDPEKDISLLNRVICNGGLVQYTRLLEKQKRDMAIADYKERGYQLVPTIETEIVL